MPRSGFHLAAGALALALLTGTPLLAQETTAEPQDAAAAADAVMKAARERAEADERAASQQLLRESRVLFPQRTEHFELQRSARDPEPLNGVTLLYRYGGNLDTDFEITARPLGELPHDEALFYGVRSHTSCFDPQLRADYPLMRVEPWVRRHIELADGRELEARHRLCSSTAANKPLIIHHTLLTYRDFYLIELNLIAQGPQSRHAARLVALASDELMPQIHVQNIGNCMPPAKTRLLIVEQIDRGADRVSIDGSSIYATKKPGERELSRLLEVAAERRRKTSCVLSFSMASLQPDEKFETLRFPPGSFRTSQVLVPARSKEK